MRFASATAALAALFAVGILAAPLPHASTSFETKKPTALKLRRVVDAILPRTLASASSVARQAHGDPVDKRGISELATLMAFTQDKPPDFLARLGLQTEFESKSSERGSKAKRKAEPRPWCWRRRYMCWKRDLSATAGGPEKRETDASSCWYPGNLCWRANLAAKEALNVADSAKPPDHAAPSCWHPGNPCWRAKMAAEGVIRTAAPREGVTNFASRRETSHGTPDEGSDAS